MHKQQSTSMLRAQLAMCKHCMHYLKPVGGRLALSAVHSTQLKCADNQHSSAGHLWQIINNDTPIDLHDKGYMVH